MNAAQGPWPTNDELGIEPSDPYEIEADEFWTIRDSNYWPVRLAKDLLGKEPPKVKALVDGFIYAGALNALVGAAKSGKSTLCWAMVDAILHGSKFLGKQCPKSKVLYVSEQSQVSFYTQIHDRLPKALGNRLASANNFYLLLPEDHRYKSGAEIYPAALWEQRLRVWQQAIANIQPDLFVLDTFGSYADLPFGGENDNATLAKRLFDLAQLKALKAELAVLALHHITKAAETNSGDYLPLSAIRGGTAFAAALDNAVTLSKREEQGTIISQMRYCYRQSRLTDEVKFDLEWKADGSYEDVTVPNSEVKLTKAQQKRLAITSTLENNPELLKCTARQLEQIMKARGISAGKTLCADILDAYREDVQEAKIL